MLLAGVLKPGVDAGVRFILDLGLEKGVMGEDSSYLSNQSLLNFEGTGLAVLEATGALCGLRNSSSVVGQGVTGGLLMGLK